MQFSRATADGGVTSQEDGGIGQAALSGQWYAGWHCCYFQYASVAFSDPTVQSSKAMSRYTPALVPWFDLTG